MPVELFGPLRRAVFSNDDLTLSTKRKVYTQLVYCLYFYNIMVPNAGLYCADIATGSMPFTINVFSQC